VPRIYAGSGLASLTGAERGGLPGADASAGRPERRPVKGAQTFPEVSPPAKKIGRSTITTPGGLHPDQQ
jgi:hypothetical protein